MTEVDTETIALLLAVGFVGCSFITDFFQCPLQKQESLRIASTIHFMTVMQVVCLIDHVLKKINISPILSPQIYDFDWEEVLIIVSSMVEITAIHWSRKINFTMDESSSKFLPAVRYIALSLVACRSILNMPFNRIDVKFVLIFGALSIGYNHFERYISSINQNNPVLGKSEHEDYITAHVLFSVGLFIVSLLGSSALWFFQIISDQALSIFIFVTSIIVCQVLHFTVNGYLARSEREELQNSLEASRIKEESRLSFMQYVLHEVRVPLNSVVLGLDVLQESAMLKDDYDMIQTIRQSAKFMVSTINDVLSWQKIEQGMFQLELAPFSPSQLIQCVISNLRAQSEEKDISFAVFIDRQVPDIVIGDRCRLEHVLANLVSNSIKFSDPKGAVEVKVALDGNTNQIRFSVKDHGIGISEEDQKNLFKPFIQIKPGSTQGGNGSGLGLSICKKIVVAHDGEIFVKSKRRVGNDSTSGGSDFIFTIPLRVSAIPCLNIDNKFNSSSMLDLDSVVAAQLIEEDGEVEPAMTMIKEKQVDYSDAASVCTDSAGFESDSSKVTYRLSTTSDQSPLEDRRLVKLASESTGPASKMSSLSSSSESVLESPLNRSKSSSLNEIVFLPCNVLICDGMYRNNVELIHLQ